MGSRLLDQRHTVGFFRDVGGHCHGVAAIVFDGLYRARKRAFKHVVALIDRTRRTHNFGALTREQLRNRLPNAPASAGDDCHLAV